MKSRTIVPGGTDGRWRGEVRLSLIIFCFHLRSHSSAAPERRAGGMSIPRSETRLAGNTRPGMAHIQQGVQVHYFMDKCWNVSWGNKDEDAPRYSAMKILGSLVPQWVKNLPAVQGTQVQPLGQEDPLEKEMTTQSGILVWGDAMGGGAWQATVHGVARVGHGLETKPPPLWSYYWSFVYDTKMYEALYKCPVIRHDKKSHTHIHTYSHSHTLTLTHTHIYAAGNLLLKNVYFLPWMMFTLDCWRWG